MISKVSCSVAILIALTSWSHGQTARSSDALVTPVEGESWLSHLHRDFGETSMGKTGRLGPAAETDGDSSHEAESGSVSQSENSSVTLHGSDLYRMNCQGCHGESGQGAPPEIGSVLNPVRATSVSLTLARMKSVGMDMSAADAAHLAQQSKAAILERLHKGGHDMPAFSDLTEAEIGSLMAYLKQLAGIPGAENSQIALREPRLRVGELIVKSTCHTCHSATGSNPSSQQLLDGAIPPLSVLPVRVSKSALVRKVTAGATIAMGTPGVRYRGRMPVFYYLRRDEAEDVYEYLQRYPPNAGPSTVLASAGTAFTGSGSGQTWPERSEAEDSAAKEAGMKDLLLWIGVGSFTFGLLAVGVWITVREFKRMSAESAARRSTIRNHGLQVVARSPIPARVGQEEAQELAGRKASAGH